MQFEKPASADMSTESDVEQKFIYPLLVAEAPSGLGFAGAGIQTKANLKSFAIGKGNTSKIYYPDYIVMMSGMPLIIVEAKAPGIDLAEAFREARLYAIELNAVYPTGLNPASKVIATNGSRLLAGLADQADPKHDLSYDEIGPTSEKMSKFTAEFGFKAVKADYEKLLPRFRPQKLWKPRKLVGGGATQREEVALNTFGATISADFSHIFNPINHQDRVAIVKLGYISSKRRERYIEPIDRIIRAATPPSISRSRTIENTAAPNEIIKTFRTGRKLEQQVLLLIGSAGAGKTTFVDYLQEVALPADIKAKTVWVRINMNPAPISRSEIYDWLRREIVEGLRLASPQTDFDDLDVIKAVHAPDITTFRKGIGRLLEKDTAAWNAKLADILSSLMSDLHKTALAMTRYLIAQTGKLLVIVLDNCDKRLRDEQLLMFEAAQWLQREFTGLVVLPLREETYDNHQNEPPLDTALKDLVFRIEPPLFQNILQSRVQMALNSIATKGSKMLRYSLPNGMHVDYPASDQAYYLSSIMRSIFDHGLHVRRLIVGLSGRNMRRALEIFLEFCTSGHISEPEYLKIRQSKGQYVLPLQLVTTVLLRLNQRFYDSSHAYLKSLVQVDEHDARVNYFVRLMIIRTLLGRMDVHGPKRLKGYEHVGVIRRELSGYGVEDAVFARELENLVRGFCVITEDYRVENLTDEDLIALAPAGLVHNQMMADVYYLAAVAEDTWFFKKDMADGIAARIKSEETHYTPATSFSNAADLIKMLRASRERERSAIDAFRDPKAFDDLTDLTKSLHAVEKFERSIVPPPWYGSHVRYPVGSTHLATVLAIKDFGIFVNMEPELDALIPASKMKAEFMSDPAFTIGSVIHVKIIQMDQFNRRMAVVPA
ncbi:S1 RNA-binding domain-containing protein [Acidocella aquatica]|nr:type I restriction enzyme HsdR N-terminal domain-containing protein [Acidocella aquatica]